MLSEYDGITFCVRYIHSSHDRKFTSSLQYSTVQYCRIEKHLFINERVARSLKIMVLLLSTLFGIQSSPTPEQTPVTENSVSPDKQGSGILIRRLLRRRREQPHISKQSILPKKPTNNGSNDDDDNIIVNDDNNNNNNNNNTSEEQDTNKNKKHRTYRPRPGDICVIRYDCYTLSPMIIARTRNGQLQFDQDQHQIRQRQRTWVDGNFNSKTGRMSMEDEEEEIEELSAESSTIFGSSVSQSQSLLQDHNQNNLVLTALEFEIGRGHVIRGLEVAVQRMSKGDIVDVTIPHLYGYGYCGHGRGLQL